MAFTNPHSAIDDTYGAAQCAEPELAEPELGDWPLTLEDFGYNGPRSGHWTVRSNSFGSAIDDRCPTVHHFGSDPEDTPAHVQPITWDVLGTFVRPTGDERKAEEDVAHDEEIFARVKEQDEQQSQSIKVPRGFCIPKTGGRGIKITSKNGRSEVVKAPNIIPPLVRKDIKQPATEVKDERAPSIQTSLKSKKALSIVSWPSEQKSVAVRIAGKNGEEKFMSLPRITPASRSVSRAPSAAQKVAAPTEEIDKNGANDKNAKTQQDRVAAEAAKQLREERTLQRRHAEERAQQQQFHEDRASPAKTAVEDFISGALPESVKALSVKQASVHTAKSVSKDSAVDFGGGSFDDESKAPSKNASKESTVAFGGGCSDGASSAPLDTTNKDSAVAFGGGHFDDAPRPPLMVSRKSKTPVPSQGATERAASQRSERAESMQARAVLRSGWQDVGAGATAGAGFQKAFSERVQERSSVGWQEVGAGITQGGAADAFWSPSKPPSACSKKRSGPLSEHSFFHGARDIGEYQPNTNRQWTPQHSFFHGARDFGGNHASTSTHGSVRDGMSPANATSQRSAQPLSERPPTVFAGRGWISPHPLSVAPSEFKEPPEPAIRLPSRDGREQGATMTYDEWKAARQEMCTVQEDGRRNFSRTSSGVRSRVAGDWAFRTMQAVPRSDGRIWSDNYQGPTVESYHSPSSRNSGEQLSQLPRTGSVTRHSSQRFMAMENDWDLPARLDGASNSGRTEEAVAAYERQMQDIISQYHGRSQQYSQGSRAPSRSWKEV